MLQVPRNGAKGYKPVDRTIAVIWKVIMLAASKFRREQAPEVMPTVYRGTRYADGIPIEAEAGRVDA